MYLTQHRVKVSKTISSTGVVYCSDLLQNKICMIYTLTRNVTLFYKSVHYNTQLHLKTDTYYQKTFTFSASNLYLFSEIFFITIQPSKSTYLRYGVGVSYNNSLPILIHITGFKQTLHTISWTQ